MGRGFIKRCGFVDVVFVGDPRLRSGLWVVGCRRDVRGFWNWRRSLSSLGDGLSVSVATRPHCPRTDRLYCFGRIPDYFYN